LAALRVRSRIFEVLRLGTPMVRATKAPLFRKTSRTQVIRYKNYNATKEKQPDPI
jgi:hypothetical protein